MLFVPEARLSEAGQGIVALTGVLMILVFALIIGGLIKFQCPDYQFGLAWLGITFPW